MRTLACITIILYALFLVTIGAILLSLSLELISIDDVTGVMYHLYHANDLKILMGTIGSALIIITLITLNILLSRIQRERTIAFSNPDGQVTIALSAIEDLIKKLVADMPEIKDMRSDIKANKKGIHIFCKTVLWADFHIPDITENLQKNIKDKLQEMLGIEEAIRVRVHVVKIKRKETAKDKKHEVPKQEPAPQYQGIQYGDK